MRASFNLFLKVAPAQLADHLLIFLEGEDLLFGLGVQPFDFSDPPREGRAHELVLIHSLFDCWVGTSWPSSLVILYLLLVLVGFDFPQNDILMLCLDNRIGSLSPFMLEHQIENFFLYNNHPIIIFLSTKILLCLSSFCSKAPNALKTDI